MGAETELRVAPSAESKSERGAKIEVISVDSRRLREAFIRLPWSLYADDPNWVPPLLMNERGRIGPVSGAADRGARRRMWIARVDGQTVGRISAQLGAQTDPSDRASIGHFGWIEAIDSGAVFEALFETAENWLFGQGMRRCTGPFNFSINEECGLLVDGFDTPPMILMPHSRPYYAGHLARLGYKKEMDLLAYKIDVKTPLPVRIEKLRMRIMDDTDFELRELNREKFEDEIRTVLDLFNDAWSGNWGFEPFSPKQITGMAKRLKPLLPPHSVCIADFSGRPVAFALGLPNINQMIRDMNGRLFPFAWVKLLYRIKFGRYGSGRLSLMGVRKEFQGTPMGAALAIAIIERLRAACREHEIYDVELSWVLETNKGVRSLLEAFGAQPYKTYRIFSRHLQATRSSSARPPLRVTDS